MANKGVKKRHPLKRNGETRVQFRICGYVSLFLGDFSANYLFGSKRYCLLILLRFSDTNILLLYYLGTEYVERNETTWKDGGSRGRVGQWNVNVVNRNSYELVPKRKVSVEYLQREQQQQQQQRGRRTIVGGKKKFGTLSFGSALFSPRLPVEETKKSNAS